MRFVVIVREKEGPVTAMRAFGVYRSFKAADADARAWGDWAFVAPLEDPVTAPEPWNPRTWPQAAE
jgi:hypothetical protein